MQGNYAELDQIQDSTKIWPIIEIPCIEPVSKTKFKKQKLS